MRPILPTDSAERKQYPLYRCLFLYFPRALAGPYRSIGHDTVRDHVRMAEGAAMALARAGDAGTKL